jgi:uncharacterized protein YeeX (DUF496 family)
MAEARKVYPIHTFVAYLRGKPGTYNQDVVDLLGFITQQPVDKEFAPFASALSKSWIYEQHPELTRLKREDVSELGENVSVLKLPADVQEEVDTIFSQLKDYKETLATQKKTIAEYEGIIEENKKKIASLETKVQDYEAQMKSEGEKKILASAAKVDEYISKVDDLLAKIEEVKKHGVVSVSGEAGAAAPEAGAPAEEKRKAEPEPDFGFGGSMGDDEFGF